MEIKDIEVSEILIIYSEIISIRHYVLGKVDDEDFIVISPILAVNDALVYVARKKDIVGIELDSHRPDIEVGISRYDVSGGENHLSSGVLGM